MKTYSENISPSAAIYSRLALSIYDFYVLSFSNSLAWKCPTSMIRQFYNNNLTNHHLDIGVGTGYFLDKCKFPVSNPEITLIDLNPNCLERTAKRIARYQPKTIVADIFKPLPLTTERFDSVGLNYLLHCLPGHFSEKAVVFKNIEPFLNQGATVFGTTILGKKANSFISRKLIKIYNAKGIMGNAEDTLEDLEKVLKQNFTSYSLWEVGCVAFFEGRKG